MLETTKPDNKTYRTLVDVVRVDGSHAHLFISGWDPNNNVRVPKANLTGDFEPGKAYLAQVNLGAEKGEDLAVEILSLAPDPDPGDGLAPITAC